MRDFGSAHRPGGQRRHNLGEQALDGRLVGLVVGLKVTVRPAEAANGGARAVAFGAARQALAQIPETAGDGRYLLSVRSAQRMAWRGRARAAALVEIDPDAAAEVRRIFDLVRSGSTIRAAAETMAAETGREWKPTVVERIAKREIYKRTEPGRIIDPRQWNAAQAALASRRRSPGRQAA